MLHYKKKSQWNIRKNHIENRPSTDLVMDVISVWLLICELDVYIK